MTMFFSKTLSVLVCLVLAWGIPEEETIPSLILESSLQENTTSKPDGNVTVELETFCIVTEHNFNYSVSCLLDNRDIFSFKNFRNWSREKENTSTIWLRIKCNRGGTVKLPWPYRSYNLVSLTISGCDLVDLYSEFYNESPFLYIEDKMETLVLIDCIEKLDFAKWQEIAVQLTNGLISPELECGPLIVKKNVMRNVTKSIEFGDDFDFAIDEDISFNETGPQFDEIPPPDIGTVMSPVENELPVSSRGNAATDADEALRQEVIRSGVLATHICDYTNWEYYENSFTMELSKFHLQSLTGNSHLPNIKVLNFTYTFQNDIPNEVLQWRQIFPRLQIVDMSHNSVAEFKFKDFSNGEPQPGYVNLQFNNISSLGEQEMNSIKQLKTILIDVKNNPFNCECSIISTFNDFLRQYSGPEDAGLLSGYQYLWNLKCKYPPKFAGRIIAELSKEILCDSDVTVYVAQIVILSVTVLILIIIIIIISRYRKDIRILVFTRLNIVRPCQPTEVDSVDLYDAFISYCSADAKWVIETLASRLERSNSTMKFKLCLHHRDFSVGDYICDNIISSVEKSRHTVLVVSNNFLKSEWCVLEFREALYKSLLEKRKHMVIILLEDISLTNVESDFRRCLQMMTYIKADDRLFWDRIQYALSRKTRCHNNVSDSKSPGFKSPIFDLQNGEVKNLTNEKDIV